MSNTSELINDTDELISYLVKQLTNDIDIPDQLDKAKELGITSFAEVGPGNSMTKIVQRHFEGAVILQKRFGTVVHINGIS